MYSRARVLPMSWERLDGVRMGRGEERGDLHVEKHSEKPERAHIVLLPGVLWYCGGPDLEGG
jgi:hypothetical protein